MSIDAPEAGLAGLQWMSRARLDQLRPPLIEDVTLGLHWGPRFDQQVMFRVAAGRDRGALLAFDSLWNEYAVLAEPISSDDARAAVRDISAPLAHHGHRVDALALYARLRYTARQTERGPAVQL